MDPLLLAGVVLGSVLAGLLLDRRADRPTAPAAALYTTAGAASAWLGLSGHLTPVTAVAAVIVCCGLLLRWAASLRQR